MSNIVQGMSNVEMFFVSLCLRVYKAFLKNKANLPAFGGKLEILMSKLVLSEVEWILNERI